MTRYTRLRAPLEHKLTIRVASPERMAAQITERDPFQEAVPCFQLSCPIPGYDGTADTACECPGCGSANITGGNQHLDFECHDCGSKF